MTKPFRKTSGYGRHRDQSPDRIKVKFTDAQTNTSWESALGERGSTLEQWELIFWWALPVHYICKCSLPLPGIHYLYHCSLPLPGIHYFYQCSLPQPVFTTSTSIHYLYQCSLPLLVFTTSTVFITSTSHMFKEEKGGQDERNTKSCPWRGLCAYSGHWAGNKKGGTSHKAAEKAEITHQDMRGTMKILLLTTGEKGRAAGSQYIWEKIEKQSTSRQPLYHHRRGILLS